MKLTATVESRPDNAEPGVQIAGFEPPPQPGRIARAWEWLRARLAAVRIGKRLHALERVQGVTTLCTECKGLFLGNGIVQVAGIEGQFCKWCAQRQAAHVRTKSKRTH